MSESEPGKPTEGFFRLGYQINELLTYCTFDGAPCTQATDWSHYLDEHYGNCYTWTRNDAKVPLFRSTLTTTSWPDNGD